MMKARLPDNYDAVLFVLFFIMLFAVIGTMNSTEPVMVETMEKTY